MLPLMIWELCLICECFLNSFSFSISWFRLMAMIELIFSNTIVEYDFLCSILINEFTRINNKHYMLKKALTYCL